MSEDRSSRGFGASLEDRFRSKPGLFRLSVTQFMISLLLLLLAYPFVVELKHGDAIEGTLVMVMLIFALLAVGARDKFPAILLVIPAIAIPWLVHYQPAGYPPWIAPVARMLFVGFVVTQLLRFILQARRVNVEVLCAGISAYLLLGLLWALAYQVVSQQEPAAFSTLHQTLSGQPLTRFDALYFSYVTLTCVGCNDITPLANTARMLVVLESLSGVLCVAVLISRLVALYSRSHGEDDDPKAGNPI